MHVCNISAQHPASPQLTAVVPCGWWENAGLGCEQGQVDGGWESWGAVLVCDHCEAAHRGYRLDTGWIQALYPRPRSPECDARGALHWPGHQPWEQQSFSAPEHAAAAATP